MVRFIVQQLPSLCQRSALRCLRLLLLVFVVPMGAYGQAYTISNGMINTCVGAFLDSGGEGASGYGNNENFTSTLCPDSPGGDLLSFITFNRARPV